MDLNVYTTKEAMGMAAAHQVADLINRATAQNGQANIILATGASQFEMLENLVTSEVDWSEVTAFHLDEYIGLPITHPASFRTYLQERFEERVQGLKQFHYVDGHVADAAAECVRLNRLISDRRIDVACVGIGENGHLAFNDPPADFDTETPFIIVELDEACRRQQMAEGWFPTLDAVPTQAISMSIWQIMQSAAVVCTVPDARKAQAVKDAVYGEVTPLVPASVLQQHSNCALFMDAPAAALLGSG